MAAMKDQPRKYRKANEIQIGDLIVMCPIGEDGRVIYDGGGLKTVARIERKGRMIRFYSEGDTHRWGGTSAQYMEGQYQI